MRKDLLAVSWLNGSLRAVSLRMGEPVGHWESEEKLEDLAQLPVQLKAAIQATNYKGKSVAFVLEHDQLTQQLVETPPTKGRDLELYLERRIDQLKIFEEEAVWSWQQTQPIKGSQGLILYIFPKAIYQFIVKACGQAGLHPLLMVHPTAVLPDLLAELPLDGESIALVAAETNGTVAVVAGRKEGPIFLARALKSAWETAPERVASGINRSTVFMRQQFGMDIGSIWLAGQNAQAVAEVIQPQVSMPVNVVDDAAHPFDWAVRLGKLASSTEANLIAKEEQNAPQRRVMVRITAALLTLMALVSIGVYAWIEMGVQAEARGVANLKPKFEKLEQKKKDLEERFAELEKKGKVAQAIDDHRLPPVPGWFLSYAVTQTPAELVLTKLQVTRLDKITDAKNGPDAGLWNVRVEGSADAALGAEDVPKVIAAFQRFYETLAAGPFHVKITDRTKIFAPRLGNAAGWTISGSENPNQFFIEGVMRETSAAEPAPAAKTTTASAKP